LWRDADIARFGLENHRAYEQTASWCGKADIARYEIVCRHGGVYVDADSVWLGRPLDPLLDEAKETGFFGAHEGSPDLVVCGFFGSVAGHPILRATIDALPPRLLTLAGAPPWISTGPALLGEVIQRLQERSSRPVATLVPFERLIAASWHGVTAAALPELIVRHRREGNAVSFQLGYSTNELWRSPIDIGRRD
jgi:mannosyltransferase OCH1-like enzyme